MWMTARNRIFLALVALTAVFVSNCHQNQTTGVVFPGPAAQKDAVRALRQDASSYALVTGSGIVAVDGRPASRLRVRASSPYRKVVSVLRAEGLLADDNEVDLDAYLLEPGRHVIKVRYEATEFDPTTGRHEAVASTADQETTLDVAAGRAYSVGGIEVARDQVGGGGRWAVRVSELGESLEPVVATSCPAGMASIPGGKIAIPDAPGSASFQAFCLDVTEVTVDAYRACVESGKCTATDVTSGDACNYAASDRGKHPMNCLDWSEANAYCQAQGKRLPTEQEWMWVALGGEENRRNPWGPAAPSGQLCWSGVQKRETTCKVGSFPAGDSRWGVNDLAGNVSEWTSSSYTAQDTGHRVRVGTSWSSDRAVFFRMGEATTDRDATLGVRCAK